MLTVASSAASAITALVAANDLPDDAGLRLSAAESANSEGVNVTLTLTQGPGPDDQVIDQDGAHVFVDPDVADVLDEHTLQATAMDDRVAFALR